MRRGGSVVGPAAKPIGGGGVIGEIAQRLLQPFERIGTAGLHPRGKHVGEDLHRIAELLALDAQLVDFLGIAQAAVGRGEEPLDHRSEAAAGVGPERGMPPPRGNILEQPLHAARPAGLDELLVPIADRLSRDFALLGKHGHEPGAGLTRLRFRRGAGCQAIGEHVEVAGFAGGAADAAQLLLEPGCLPVGDQVAKRVDCGDRPSRGHPQLVHRLGIAAGLARGGRQERPDGIEPSAERARGDIPGRHGFAGDHVPPAR